MVKYINFLHNLNQKNRFSNKSTNNFPEEDIW